MRVAIAAILLAGALWQGWIDWRATIGEGYAYRFTSIGSALARASPERFAAEGAAGDGGAGLLLAAPLAPVLLALAALVWFARRRRKGR